MKRRHPKSSVNIVDALGEEDEEPNLLCTINESDSDSEHEEDDNDEAVTADGSDEETQSSSSEVSDDSEGEADGSGDETQSSPSEDSDDEVGSEVSTTNSEVSPKNSNKVSIKDKDATNEQKTDLSEKDEYEEGDTSDEEDIRNTIGNIPLNWYDDHEHIGYDWDGKKIIKAEQGDQLDYFLKQMEDPNFWRTVKDSQTGQDIVLSDKDIELIKRLGAHKIPDKDYDEYAPWVEWFTSDVMEMPIRKFPEHKRSFIPSKDEMKRVSKYVYALKMGWMKSRRAIRAKKRAERTKGPQFYMLWKSDDVAEEMRRINNHIPAPKRPLPGHSESYNPPEEYLFNEREMKKWEKERKSLGEKKLHFVPQKYNSLREVPAYKRLIRERFLRCLDLYMCPRAVKMRLTIEPEDLLPQLPDPKNLQPFPTVMSLVYKGHTDMVRSIAVDITGQYLASVSDDETLKIWEVNTGRCLNTVPLGSIGRCVVWCPSTRITLVAVAADKRLLLINPKVGDNLAQTKTDRLLGMVPPEEVTKIKSERVKSAVNWEHIFSGEQYDVGIRVVIHHFKEVKQVAFHGKANYFVTVLPEGQNRAVIVHQLTRRTSQLPFTKPRGLVQAALFHPIKPRLIVATQKHVRIYDLVKQEMIQKLMSNSKWISSIAIHPGGDNLLVGTYDKKLLWFDLDLSCKPYKSLALHSQAIRGVAYHKRYPLFASTSDDQSLIVSHGMIYNDLLQNPLIVPLKRFTCHEKVNDFSVFDVKETLILPKFQFKNIQDNDDVQNVVMIWFLHNEIIKKLEHSNLYGVYTDVEMPAQFILMNMEMAGFGFNRDKAMDLWTKTEEMMRKLEKEAFLLANKKFSINSWKEFKKIKEELKIKNDFENEHPLLGVVRNWRKLNSLKSRTLSNLLMADSSDGRLYTECCTRTNTGRIVVYNPHLQHVPRDFSVGNELFSPRSTFIASKSDVLLSADFCQLELRILTHLSKDPLLTSMINSNIDVFVSIASGWFKVDCNQVNEEMRHQTKQICYGILYGMGDISLGESLGVSTTEAAEMAAKFRLSYPGVNKFIEKCVEDCRNNGYITTITGRIRKLPNINSRKRAERLQAERQAVNSTIQGSAADIAKKAMVNIERRLTNVFPQRTSLLSRSSASHLVLQLHDELIYQVAEENIAIVSNIVKNEMENTIKLSVPLPVVLKAGKSWGELKKINI
ncbi:hypothetical protein O3M35_008360 [Rhynocoris fuscipes]|uniref:Ribosome biogenesis protein BOP1 homolog n=1 Tax=Rhynocoris fuscipes TaxID=488301 RepID=A0AAW1D9H3_9HEMI